MFNAKPVKMLLPVLMGLAGLLLLLPLTRPMVSSAQSAQALSLEAEPGQVAASFDLPLFEPVNSQDLAISARDNAADDLAMNLDVADTDLGAEVGQVATLAALNGSEPTVQFETPSYSVDENGGSATVTATLSFSSAFTVTVGYETSGGTATAGDDYTAVSGTLTFEPEQTEQHFEVPILPDSLYEGNETVGLALVEPVVSATLGTTSTAILAIVDAEGLPSVIF
ncbi:MAG: hypothetical protein JSV81_01760, partial [Anaerolineales bacterium]